MQFYFGKIKNMLFHSLFALSEKSPSGGLRGRSESGQGYSTEVVIGSFLTGRIF
jgi:hypothetical protein